MLINVYIWRSGCVQCDYIRLCVWGLSMQCYNMHYLRFAAACLFLSARNCFIGGTLDLRQDKMIYLTQLDFTRHVG